MTISLQIFQNPYFGIYYAVIDVNPLSANPTISKIGAKTVKWPEMCLTVDCMHKTLVNIQGAK